ncbi:hypothetical protein EJB05_57258, partial [Eragrostis curvula]
MDGGSSSLPLSPPPPQVYLRRPVPPPEPAQPPKVHYFRSPAPIPIFSGRAPVQRNGSRPLMPPPPAPHAFPAAQAPPRPQPPPQGPAAKEQLPPRPPLPPHAMLPPRPPQPPPGAVAMLPPPAPQAVPKGQEKATPPFNDENIGIGNSQTEVNREGTVQGHDKASATAPVKVIKRPKKVQAAKRTLDGSDIGTIEGDAGPLFSSNHCRYDSSLSLLTKKFISLLRRAEDGTIDLNKAAEMLEVQKRRIYDITNVLEGVDLIEKTLKNMIRWKGFDMSKPKETELQISSLKEELESLNVEEDRLDVEIREAKDKLEALKLDEDKRKFRYVLKEDISKLPHFQGYTLIAINAPRGTCLEVPDPYEDKFKYGELGFTDEHYRIIVRSSMGPIDCYLLSSEQETFNPDHQVMPNNSKPVATVGSAQAGQHMDCDPHQSVQHMDCDPHQSVQKMDCDQNETVQQMHCDSSRAPKKGESDGACTHTSEPSRRPESTAGILRIVPSYADADADYWFASDPDLSVTDTWGS